jgi:uncharacterized protein (DUF362 family)
MSDMSSSRRNATSKWTRREFGAFAGFALAGASLHSRAGRHRKEPRFPVALVRNPMREAGLGSAWNLLGDIDFSGEDVYLKASYNSADPYPATTHPETLTAVVNLLRKAGCRSIALIERSGMGSTQAIWENLGILRLARQLDIRAVALEDLPATEWRLEELPDSGWKYGIEVPEFLDRNAIVVQICNLKTHRFGGVFSASLKNTIGMIAKNGHVKTGHNYMKELHNAQNQGALIADANLWYAPKLIFMDAIQVFADGGPESGEVSEAEVIMISRDRVAIDAAGYALLRSLRENRGRPASAQTIFEQDQLKRAIELHLGATGSAEIEFQTGNDPDALLAFQLEALLKQLPKDEKK